MKKKIFFYSLMLTILANVSFSQVYQAETVYGRNAKRLTIDSTLRIPNGLSTRTNSYIGDSSGLIALKDTTDGVYYFTGQRWKQLGGGGASGLDSTVASGLFVPQARTISTGWGLSGGGNLSANRTFIADSATLSTYYLRIGDSSIYYPYRSNPLGYLTTASLAGYVPTSRTITINGVAYDLSTNRSWSVGTLIGADTINIKNRLDSISAASGSLPSLANGKIWVGNGSNAATAVTPSGDWTISNAGVNTLAAVNSNVGTFGSASKTVTTTVNGKGLITAISEQNIAIAESQVTNLVTDLAGKEPALGNPASNGYVLSSTTSGTRSWVAQSGGSSLDTTTIYNYLEKKKSNSTSVYNKSYWTAGTDFTISGTTPTYNSDGSIRITATSTLEINNTASSEDNFDMSATYKLSAALSTSSSGLYVGKNGSSYNFYVGVSFANTNNAVVKFYANASLIDSAKIGLIPSLNDVISIRVIKTGSNFRFEYENVTTNEKGSYELRNNLKSVGTGNFIPPNTGNYTVWALGGQMDISSIKVIGNNATNGKIAVIGDSKTALAAGAELLRFPNLLKGKGDVSIYSGPGDATLQILSEISYIAKHRYKYVILNIGHNDISGGTFGATAQGRYQQIVDSLTAYGSTVIHLLPIPEGSSPALGLQTSLKTWIQTQYSGGLLVDPSTGWTNSTMVSADSIHPTSEGHRYVANAILATGYLPAVNDSTSAPDPIYVSRQTDTRYNLGVPLDAVVFGNLAHPGVNASNGAEVAIGWKSQFATILTATLNLNTSVGAGSLAANTTGNNNTAIGNGALLSSTTVSDNTAVGSSALRTATGTTLTAVGSNAGTGILTGSGVYYGKSTTSATLAATGVVVVGNNAKAGNTNDVIVGDASGGATGQNNVGVGNTVLKNGSGGSNTIVGHAATLNTTLNGSQNVGIGFGAMYNIGTTTMANSIAIGAFSMNTQTAGGYNVGLGAYVQMPSTTGSGQLNALNILYGINGYQTASNSSTPTTTGSIGIGLTTPTARLMLPAGTATASMAPLKFTSGTNLTTPENGAVEYDGTRFYVTVGGVRYYADMTLTGTAAPATTPAAIGIHFLDTTNKKEYVATGTSSSADWTILN